MGKVLSPSFYARPTLEVAQDLLGKVIVVRGEDGLLSGRIVETEAYRADDPASHSARGETPRASIMFGSPGVAYVYFIYGMYEMLNFVTEPAGQAGAVLIRALEPCAGEEAMMQLRARGRVAKAKPLRRQELASGPGKLCRALGIQLSDNGASLQGPRLAVEDDGFLPGRISTSPRVGITAGTDRFWRFFLSGHPCVSRAPQNAQARVLKLKDRV